jgi:cell division transport system permease protein
VDFNNQRILAFIAVLLINSSLRLSIHSIDLSLKLCKWWVQQSFIRKPFVMRSIKLGMLGAGLAIIALIVAIRRD